MNVRTLKRVAIVASAALTACHGFKLNRFPTNESLYTAAVSEFNKHHWGNAATAFEKLTNDLPARDTLLPRAYWFLAAAHDHQSEYLLSAQSYTRLYESFPDDTLADDAAVQAARAYRRLWRKPTLDAGYGETALATYSTAMGLYGPTMPVALSDSVKREMAELDQWFATKNYETGLFYFRRKAYDSAILYFKYVLERWPGVPRAREALLRLAESYKAIRYREDLAETCTKLRSGYPGDREITQICGVTSAGGEVKPTPAKH